jgi:hypothetical protein
LSFSNFLKVYVLIEVICCSLSALFMIYVVTNYERLLTKITPEKN